jgi:glycosyltransferase involved in cell wall biosynthesis
VGEWLAKALHGYLYQTFADFELLIADDGSDQRTEETIADFRKYADFPIKHVWQADDGFQKTRILNKAITAAGGDYLVFSDGDCIPRADFLEAHARHAGPGRFLSGGYCKLSQELSVRINEDDVKTGRAFDLRWLRNHGFRGFSKSLRIAAPPKLAPVLDALTPTKATWNGHNASGWKADIIAVNGFNERMQYGGEDREMGERLTNFGIRGHGIRHQAIVLHLDHKRGYATQEMIRANLAIRDQVRSSRSIWCPDGIQKRAQP